jgi:benzoyl-CoA reductase/2-hydroxyglutaryl-CoA dehydratase subunit BcrC/BadD/HgdB
MPGWGMLRDPAAWRSYYRTVRAAGRRVVGTCGGWAPEELFYAYRVLPVRMTGRTRPGQHLDGLPAFLCSFVRNLHADLVSGVAGELDGLVIPASCDSLIGLYACAASTPAIRPRLFLLQAPAGAGDGGLRYYRSELARLESWLRDLSGNEPVFDEAVAVVERVRGLLREAARHVAEGRGSFAELYRLALLASLVDQREIAGLLEAHVAGLAAAAPRPGPSLLLVGPITSCGELLEHIEACGARITRDYTTVVGRALALPPDDEGADVRERLARRYLRRAPSPTGPDLAGFRESVERLAREVDGVIVINQKFCEPYALQQRMLDRLGRRVMYLEIEEHQATFEREKLLLETFVRTLG